MAVPLLDVAAQNLALEAELAGSKESHDADELFTANNSYIVVDPNSLPAGITINAAGTQISMTKDAINNIDSGWLNVGRLADPMVAFPRRVLLMSAADQNATSPIIWPNH
jgi:hypothetical protein